MLLDSLHLVLRITAFLVIIAITIDALLKIAPPLGRPLVRRLFGLAYSDDQAALTQTGEIATLILSVLIIGIWISDCARETAANGLLLTEWSAGTRVRVMMESVAVAIAVEGLLSGLMLVLPGAEHGEGDGDRGRRTLVKSVF